MVLILLRDWVYFSYVSVCMTRQTVSSLKMTQMNTKKKMAWGRKLINEILGVIAVQWSPFGLM